MAKNRKRRFDRKKAVDRKPKNLEDRSLKRERKIVLGFRDFDKNQGQNFEEWEKEQLLALACNKLAGLCQFTVAQALQNKMFKIYMKVDFPPKSAFVYPKHIDEGVKWVSMHIQGKECVIGYFEDNVFQIVFLDKNHEFWITQKKHT